MNDLSNACTWLFVPGHRAGRFEKAIDSGADAVILDLEDAVPLSEKNVARHAISQAWRAWTSSQKQRLVIRMNALNHALAEQDLQWLTTLEGLSAIMVPKAESADDLQRVAKVVGPSVQLVPLIETARGVHDLHAIAQAPQVLRLALGHLDLQADLGMACGADEAELSSVRFQLVVASRCARLPAPIDGVSVEMDDAATVRAHASRSRRFGFFAKLCIHPKQLVPVREAFLPTTAEHHWAQRVFLAQEAAGGGAFSVDGKMVDPPLIALAQQILRLVPA
jgi:citrate lyase subunit beta/citryl-CoA lyase